MKIAIAGASGRMGRVLTRIVHETKGLEIAGGIESKGSPSVGADMGELAGVGRLDVRITDDPLPLFTRIEGLIDFTVPQATLALAELSLTNSSAKGSPDGPLRTCGSCFSRACFISVVSIATAIPLATSPAL